MVADRGGGIPPLAAATASNNLHATMTLIIASVGRHADVGVICRVKDVLCKAVNCSNTETCFILVIEPLCSLEVVNLKPSFTGLLQVSKQSRLYHQPFWLRCASGHLTLLPSGIVVALSP